MSDKVINHRIHLFTEQLLDISIENSERKKSIAKYCDGIDKYLLDSYRPIDWHCDFYSGYRWSPDSFFLDIRVAPVLGVDIKVPRELSRFQHLSALVYGDQERASHEFMMQVSDWIIANPYGHGVNWACAMDVAIRAINWIWGLRYFEPILTKHKVFQVRIANSLRDHGRHIYENLDYYGAEIPTGNHYLADIAGLIYIGAAFPDFPEADLWLLFGIQELISESQREVLHDGMCHEASTSYHRLVTELFVSSAALIERIPISRRKRLINTDVRLHRVQPPLDLLSSQFDLTSEAQILPPSFYSRLELMADFVLAMRKPNGLIFQLGDNDSARVHKLVPEINAQVANHDHILSSIGILLNNNKLKVDGGNITEGQILCGDVRVIADVRDKGAIQHGIQLFPNAGIATQLLDRGWLGVSCGESGQGGRGGHGHNDKNSFELNVNQLDFVVDGGCPAYTYDPNMRNRFRSTAMHSTIYVEGVEQNNWPSGIKGLFMLPEKASPELMIENGSVIKGLHYGFGVCHTRRFNLLMNGLQIDDHFEDDRDRYIVFNLHPKVSVTSSKSNDNLISFVLQHKDGTALRLDVTGGSTFDVLPGAYSVGYMRPLENNRLRIKIDSHKIKSIFSW